MVLTSAKRNMTSFQSPMLGWIRLAAFECLVFAATVENADLMKEKLGETFVATRVQPPRSVSMSQKAWNESSVEPPFGSIQ